MNQETKFFQIRQDVSNARHHTVFLVSEGEDILLLTVSERALPLLELAVETANNFAQSEGHPNLNLLVESHEVHEIYENGWDVASTQYTRIVQEATKHSERRLMSKMADALEPFAEDPTKQQLVDAPCHRGITTVENCGSCGRGIKAYEALQAAREYLSTFNNQKPLHSNPEVFNADQGQ